MVCTSSKMHARPSAENITGKRSVLSGMSGCLRFIPTSRLQPEKAGLLSPMTPSIAIKVRKLRNQGRDDSEEWFQHSELGYNYPISDINCALGIEQLKRIDAILCRRESIAFEYSQVLGHEPELRLPLMARPDGKISWFVYVIRLSGRFNEVHRDRIVNEMKLRGIAVGRYFAPIHLQPVYRSRIYRKVVLPVTEFHASRALALPFFNRIRKEEIAEVCGTLVELIRSGRPAG